VVSSLLSGGCKEHLREDTVMHKLSRIATIALISAFFFGLSAQTQTPDPLQIIREETAKSVRKQGPDFKTTYENFEINTCKLSFVSKTVGIRPPSDYPGNHDYLYKKIYKYSFPLNNMDIRLEWLDTYRSNALSIAGQGTLTILDVYPDWPSVSLFPSPSPSNIGSSYQAPNISIPFVNENSAKRVEKALQEAMASCRVNDSAETTSNSAGQEKEDHKPEPNDELFKVAVKVDLVTTDVMVMGDNVPELRAEDFAVYDNGVAQQISHFSHDQPISIALVVRNSTSFFEYEALKALRILRTGDQITLYSTSGDRLCDLTEDRFKAFNIIRFMGHDQYHPEDLFGAIYDAARYLKREAPGPHAIILLGCNDDMWGGRKEAEHTEQNRIELLETATTLYDLSIEWNNPDWQPPPGQGDLAVGQANYYSKEAGRKHRRGDGCI
jgi:hypothetical protein